MAIQARSEIHSDYPRESGLEGMAHDSRAVTSTITETRAREEWAPLELRDVDFTQRPMLY